MALINSHESMKTLQKLLQERNLLIKRQCLAELTDQLLSLITLKKIFQTDMKQIETCTENINNNFDKVEEIITGKTNRKYIPMLKQTAQNLKDVKNNIIEVFHNIQEISCDVNIEGFSDKGTIEFLAQEISVCQNDNRNLYKYSTKLICNIKVIGNGPSISNAIIKQGGLNNPMSSGKKQRLRRSHLSESTFLNTFQDNNVSASSPIAEHRVIFEGTENVMDLPKKLF